MVTYLPEAFNCSGTGPNLLFINNRSCGLRYYSDRIDSCCGDAPLLLLRDCYQYCAYPGTVDDWVNCVSSNETRTRTDAFCQDVANTTVVTSIRGLTPNSAVRASSPKLTLLLAGIMLLTLFTSGTSAICSSYEQTRIATKGGRQVSLEDPVACEDPYFCARTVLLNQTVDRTLDYANGSVLAPDATIPAYDDFFLFIAAQAGMQLPALSQVRVFVDAVFYGNQTSFLTWVPYLNCTTGTVRYCGTSTPGIPNGTEVEIEACGPVFFGNQFEEGPDGEFFKVTTG